MIIEICDVCKKVVDRGETFLLHNGRSEKDPHPTIDCCSKECQNENLRQEGLKRRVKTSQVRQVKNWCDILEEVSLKEDMGTLTFGEAPINTYLELQDGPHVGRVVIKPHRFAEIDSEPITWFAREMTWIMVKDIESCIVIRKHARFVK